MPVTLKDIARDLDLSVVTVSKVLRNHPDIGENTRERVLQRMKELDYQPNLAARSLLTGRTATMGLIVPDLLHPFFARILATLSAQVRFDGYGIIISSSEEDADLEREEIEQLLARRVDVLIIASCQSSPDAFRRIESRKVPYLLLDRYLADVNANFVGVDDEAVGFLATNHLLEQGCVRIAHVRGPDISTATGRLKGYTQALANCGRLPFPGHVVSIGRSADHLGERSGYEAAQKLLENKNRPDGIFCFNDPIALGAMRAILDNGLRVPEDVAVIGCGNLSYSDFLRVPLSTVEQNSQGIAEKAAKIALTLAKSKKQPPPRHEIVTPQLIVRASSLRHPVNAPQ
jgi:LacI family transcriptional regulator